MSNSVSPGVSTGNEYSLVHAPHELGSLVQAPPATPFSSELANSLNDCKVYDKYVADTR